ncbi:MAG: hypothetical protein BWY27_00940 [Bacteroidetes bacterium ADurb.Bin234]|nr:MAG: hypothetical protein BWY27_00940 [Bacteroidetes bacterium ADurb.Bin234]
MNKEIIALPYGNRMNKMFTFVAVFLRYIKRIPRMIVSSDMLNLAVNN